MKTPCITSLKIVLWTICIFHLIVGFLGCLPFLDVVQLGATVYKAHVTPSAQLEHIVRMLAGYMFTIGLLAFFAVRNPLENSSIITALTIFLYIRVFQIVLFGKDEFDVFGVPPFWYWGEGALILGLALGLTFLRPRPDSSCCKD